MREVSSQCWRGSGRVGSGAKTWESGGFAFSSPKPLKGTQCDNGVFSDFWVLFPCSAPTLPQNDQMAIKSEYLDQIWKWGSSQLLGSSSDKVLEEIGQERIPKGQVDVTGQNGAQIINKKTETEDVWGPQTPWQTPLGRSREDWCLLQLSRHTESDPMAQQRGEPLPDTSSLCFHCIKCGHTVNQMHLTPGLTVTVWPGTASGHKWSFKF